MGGGGHAIKLYLSDIKADEIQVRGRIARKSEPGSYTLLLNWSDLKAKGLFSVSGSKLEELKGQEPSTNKEVSDLYLAVDDARNKKAEEVFSAQIKQAENALAASTTTTRMLDEVRNYFQPSMFQDNEKLWAA